MFLKNRSFFYEHWKEIKEINKTHLVISLIVFLVGWRLNYSSSFYLFKEEDLYGKFPILKDFFFEHLPFLPKLSFFYDIFALLSVFILIFSIIYYKQYKKIPFFIFLFGVGYLMRSLFIVLTPLGNPRSMPTNGPFHAFTNYESGVFPSGHVGSSFLCFLFSKGIFKIFSLISLILVIAFLLVARGHYSIDIFSAILFNYASYSFFQKSLTDWEK